MNTIRLISVCAIFVMLITAPVFAICGDADGNGMVTISDAIYGFQYLYGGGPALVNGCEFDQHEGFTANDISVLVNVCPWYNCDFSCTATLPPLPVSSDTTIEIIYPQYMWRGISQYTLKISLRSQLALEMLVLPLRIRIGGEIPQIDSIQFPANGTVSNSTLTAKKIYADSGYVSLALLSLMSETTSTRATIAKVFVTMPVANFDRPVAMEFVELSPLNAPAPDSSIRGMATDIGDITPVAPRLRSDCCSLAGDADANGIVTISDALEYICYIFGCGGGVAQNTAVCMGQYDANNDGHSSISDAVFLISYIFSGGPAPLCPYERP